MSDWMESWLYDFVGPWGKLDTDDLENTRFGFFGEFGYGIIAWLPYLKYLKAKGVPIRSAGLRGSSAVWHFSDDHLELDLPVGDSWGTLEEVLRARKALPAGERLISPTNGRQEGLEIAGMAWQNPYLHRRINASHYAPLELPADPTVIPGRYVVVNIKDYFNWSNEDIPNCYYSHDIVAIARKAASRGLSCVINRFPAPLEWTSNYFKEDPLAGVLSEPNVIDLATHYAQVDDLAGKNRLQFGVFRGAEHVFATQGGNAVLSIMLGRQATILMRGGFDYPDFISLSEIYGAPVDIVFELHQAAWMRESS